MGVRALAGPVRADHSERLAVHDSEGHVPQGPEVSGPLVAPQHPDERLVHRRLARQAKAVLDAETAHVDGVRISPGGDHRAVTKAGTRCLDDRSTTRTGCADTI